MPCAASGSTSLLRSALAYARFGMAVFPGHSRRAHGQCTCGKAGCNSPAKHPRIKARPQKATKDAEVISEWWKRWPNSNVCVAAYSADRDRWFRGL